MDDGTVLMDEFGVSLSTAIGLLRSELQEALADGTDSQIRFAVDSIELELELVVDATRDVSGKLTLWRVLSAGGGRKHTDTATHRMTLTLTPRDTSLPMSKETLIGDDS
ncbi:trypco2 family protein [Micromonospora sp. NPDC005173]|uniref:trypco2 family protein n=1 Tax=Micromonospora sp. NPDC005173 TaxID=3157165 RepID=UPI0033BF5339